MAQYRLTVVVEASVRDQVNAKLLPLNHGETFTAPLAPTGQTIATHYWSSHDVDDDQLAKLQTALAAEIAEVPCRMAWFFDVEPAQVLSLVNLAPLR
jgi:hypothetical protein